jgi:hypothetical protein
MQADLTTLDDDLSAVWCHDSRENLDESRFSRPVVAGQGDDLSPAHLHLNVSKCSNSTVGLREADDLE